MLHNLFRKKESLPTREVQLYNTASRELEIFTPLSSKQTLMYTCGPTVYDFATIGNLRSYVFADILKRVLIRNGYLVKQTINLTDFGHLTDDGDAGEDKIMKGLNREGLPITLEAMRELSDKFIHAFKADMESMRILEPDTWARASDYVKQQVALIKALDSKGFTYETSDGVYFDISKFPAYGVLGNIDLDQLKSGARVEVNNEKRHPADFAVWKKGKLGWQSKYGTGFPGWHMECSAMAIATLGKQIDVHTGGIDHIPVHHNAEIAQSECATGKQFARYWLHNEFLTIENKRVGKSVGNALTLRHLRDRGISGDDYRYWLLTAHYRSPINFSWEALEGAKQALFRIKRYMYEEFQQKASFPSQEYLERFEERMAHDLDTPGAIAIMWEMLKDDSLDNPTKCGTLLAMDDMLDIGLSENLDHGQRMLGVITAADLPEEVQQLVDEREAARIIKNWTEADRLRDALKIKGYLVEDTQEGPKVTKE